MSAWWRVSTGTSGVALDILPLFTDPPTGGNGKSCHAESKDPGVAFDSIAVLAEKGEAATSWRVGQAVAAHKLEHERRARSFQPDARACECVTPACACKPACASLRAQSRTCGRRHEHLGVIAQCGTLRRVHEAGHVRGLAQHDAPRAQHHALRRESGACRGARVRTGQSTAVGSSARTGNHARAGASCFCSAGGACAQQMVLLLSR